MEKCGYCGWMVPSGCSHHCDEEFIIDTKILIKSIYNRCKDPIGDAGMLRIQQGYLSAAMILRDTIKDHEHYLATSDDCRPRNGEQ